MKSIKSLLVLFSAILIASCSTDDVEDRPFIEAIDAPVLVAPINGSIYTLKVEDNNKLAERFVWSEANFGGDVQINYAVQMDVAGNQFAAPIELGSVNSENQLGVSVETINGSALSLGAEPFTAAPYEIRVKATVGAMEMFSNIIAITVSAFTTDAPKIYVVGSFLSASGYGGDWTPENGVPLAATGYGETKFEGFVYIASENAEFKFLPTNTGWDGDYGDTGENNGDYSGTIEQQDEVNAGTPGRIAGYFLVKVDTEALTYSLTHTNWGIIGSATPTGWDSDTNMIYNAETKVWEIYINLEAGEFKFRANDDWDINLGKDNDGDGFLNFGGDNFNVETPGNYRIVLDLSNPRAYMYSITLN